MDNLPGIALGLIIASIGFLVADVASGKRTEFKGTIHELHFVHGNQSTSVGMAFTSKGAAPVIMNSGHPDEWSVIINYNDHFRKVECTTDQYYGHEIGDEVTVLEFNGGITGSEYALKLVR